MSILTRIEVYSTPRTKQNISASANVQMLNILKISVLELIIIFGKMNTSLSLIL
jgi:hypothetical protein